jgi:hypothetical protein
MRWQVCWRTELGWRQLPGLTEEANDSQALLNVCMALTPDAIPHLSHPLTAPDPAADARLAEGLAALESYKKKDPAKGPSVHRPSVFGAPLRVQHSPFDVGGFDYPQLSCASRLSEMRP